MDSGSRAGIGNHRLRLLGQERAEGLGGDPVVPAQFQAAEASRTHQLVHGRQPTPQPRRDFSYRHHFLIFHEAGCVPRIAEKVKPRRLALTEDARSDKTSSAMGGGAVADEKKRGGAWGWDWSFGWGAVPGAGRGGGIPTSITAQPSGPRVRDIPGPIGDGNGGPFGSRGRAERNLIVALLAQAQDDLRHVTHQWKAAAWIMAPPVDWPFSFENCCHYVGLNPGRVRDAWGFPKRGAATYPLLAVHQGRGRPRQDLRGPWRISPDQPKDPRDPWTTFPPPRPVPKQGRKRRHAG